MINLQNHSEFLYDQSQTHASIQLHNAHFYYQLLGSKNKKVRVMVNVKSSPRLTLVWFRLAPVIRMWALLYNRCTNLLLAVLLRDRKIVRKIGIKKSVCVAQKNKCYKSKNYRKKALLIAIQALVFYNNYLQILQLNEKKLIM